MLAALNTLILIAYLNTTNKLHKTFIYAQINFNTKDILDWLKKFFENEQMFIRCWLLRYSHSYLFSACIFCIWTWWRFRFKKFCFQILLLKLCFDRLFSFRVLGETLNVFHPSGRRDSGNYTCVVFNGVTNTSASFLVTAQGKDYKLVSAFVIFLVFLYRE